MKSKILLLFLLMLIGIVAAGYFGPWWAPAAYIVLLSMLLKAPANQAIWTGSVAMLILYTIWAYVMLGKDNTGLIAKTGSLLGGWSPSAMVILTGVIGAITGLVSGWLGSSLAKVLSAKK
jgi:hypothetical protein